MYKLFYRIWILYPICVCVVVLTWDLAFLSKCDVRFFIVSILVNQFDFLNKKDLNLLKWIKCKMIKSNVVIATTSWFVMIIHTISTFNLKINFYLLYTLKWAVHFRIIGSIFYDILNMSAENNLKLWRIHMSLFNSKKQWKTLRDQIF